MSVPVFIVFSALMLGVFLLTLWIIKRGADKTVAARDRALTPGNGTNAPPDYKPGPPLKKGKSALSPAIRWSLHYTEDLWTLQIKGDGPIADTAGGDGFFTAPNARHDWVTACGGAPAHLTVAPGVTELGRRAFAGMQLRSAAIPGTVKRVGAQAFQNCALQTVWLAEGVERLEAAAFSGCGHLKAVYLPASLSQIDDAAFGDDPAALAALTFFAPENSPAARWAAEKGLPLTSV